MFRYLPYGASVFNISAMSFGSLSANAIRALNAGARKGGFYHDTGEGSISPYHREPGGDLVWEIGSGYFGCRDADGRFSDERFAANATSPQVKMVEIKLSQGAKPGHGGMLPGAKVSAEIAATRGVLEGVDRISPVRHTEFSTPVGLLEFVARLRRLSGGKPTGIKLAIGHPWEWFGLAKAMHETGILPDFIVVDGAEGGTGAAPAEFIEHVGVPMHEGLMLVHNTLVGLDLRGKIRIAAAGKVVSAFDIARTLAMGADWCNAGRGFMFALGCIQARICHTERCPTGITTQNPERWKHLDVADKSNRVFMFQQNTLHALRTCCAPVASTAPSSLAPSTSCAGSRRWKCARCRPCIDSWSRASCCAVFPSMRCSRRSGPTRAATASPRRQNSPSCAPPSPCNTGPPAMIFCNGLWEPHNPQSRPVESGGLFHEHMLALQGPL